MENILHLQVSEPNGGLYQEVAFIGQFDKLGFSQNVEQLEDIINAIQTKFLVFNFSQLSFINSEGIGFLIKVHSHLVKEGRSLVIVGLSEFVRDVLTTIGIGQVLKIYDDINAFIAENKTA